ncbi:MAG: tagatose 1,6-diphosphate aldolase [Anaerolineae bacterium]|nr:tagatose 1,6-diphosphate aldolase [Anaerolineae bacterium]
MLSLSIGKRRLLQQCSTSNGALAILALDQRNNLRQALNAENPDAVTYADMVAFKREVICTIGAASSAVLLDPEFGAAQCIQSAALPGKTGLVAALEATGYTGDPTARESQVLPGWSVAKAKRMGANAVKLLVYYHPDAPSAAGIESLTKQVAAECAEHEMPLFVEPLSYSPDPARKKLSPDERTYVVLESARRLTPLGADALKAEFPLDAAAEMDETRWFEACQQLSQASVVPWVLLSAGVDFDTYLRQVVVACRAGASGVAAGRAVWKEATTVSGEARRRMLAETAYRRMERLTEVCNGLARPWTDFFTTPDIEENWYAAY